MDRSRAGRFVDEPFPNLCDWVAHPDVPSPAGGTVIATCGALVTALAELIGRVTSRRLEREGSSTEFMDQWVEEMGALRARLLDYGEGDVYEAQKIIQGERAACVRKDVGSPAKIAGTVVKVLRIADQMAEHVRPVLYSDLRVVAYMGQAAVFGITEIALANIRSAGGADANLLDRIERWRQEASEYQARILART